jgi:hypothetical protein
MLPRLRNIGRRERKDGMPIVDLGDDVTPYIQENGQYCGEATAQMTRNGYPKEYGPVYYTQAYLYNIIQCKNSTEPGDQCEWNTDPKGLRECLQLLSSPPVNWVECANIDGDTAQQFIMDCIEQSRFPVPVVVQKGLHWVLVVGWETRAPQEGGDPVLMRVRLYDPEPKEVGSKGWISAKKWNADYFSKVYYGKIWRGTFVAVGQRP